MAPEVATDPTVVTQTEQTAPKIDAPMSVAEHAKSFDPQRQEPEPREPDGDDAPVERDTTTGKFQGRRRAESQKATPGDVEQINALTKQLREAEEASGIVRKPNESQRVFELRRKVEMAAAIRDWKKNTAAPPVNVPPVRPTVPQVAGEPFNEAEPTIEQFADKADPYSAWQRALASWDRRKDAHDAKQSETKTQTVEQLKKADTDFVQWAKTTTESHDTRLGLFLKSNPDAKLAFDSAAQTDVVFSPVMVVAYETHERGPEMMLKLAQDTNLRRQLILATTNQRAFDDQHNMNPLVAETQRLILDSLQGAQAGTTGSAASPRPVTVAPTPLNPVRTAPQTPSETPPTEGSIAAHSRSYGQRR